MTNDGPASWTPLEAYAHIRELAEHPSAQRVGTSADAFRTVALMLQHTACPHADCPRLVLEEHTHEGGELE